MPAVEETSASRQQTDQLIIKTSEQHSDVEMSPSEQHTASDTASAVTLSEQQPSSETVRTLPAQHPFVHHQVDFPEDDDETYQWEALKTGVWYHISSMKDVNLRNPKRSAKILTVASRDDVRAFELWTSQVVTKMIDEKLANRSKADFGKELYIKSYGVKVSISKPDRVYHNARVAFH